MSDTVKIALETPSYRSDLENFLACGGPNTIKIKKIHFVRMILFVFRASGGPHTITITLENALYKDDFGKCSRL